MDIIIEFFLLICLLYIWICFLFCDKSPALSGAVKEGLLETSYVMAGFVFYCGVFSDMKVSFLEEKKEVIMLRKLTVKLILTIFILTIVACGGLRFSQSEPEAVNFHPKRIAVFPIEVWNHKEADSRAVVEQIVAGSLVEKKFLTM